MISYEQRIVQILSFHPDYKGDEDGGIQAEAEEDASKTADDKRALVKFFWNEEKGEGLTIE